MRVYRLNWALLAVVFSSWTTLARGQVPGQEDILKSERERPEIPRTASGTAQMKISSPSVTEVTHLDGTSPPAPIPLEEPLDPDQYICGRGDTFELNFWGQQNFKLRVTVDLEGRTFVSK